MLRSMTGFGKGSAANGYGVVTIEIKSLNYKFFEVVSKLPPNLTIFEDNIREYLQKRIPRGRLNLFLTYENKNGSKEEFCINKKLGKQYCKMLLEFKKHLGLAGGIELGQIMSLPGVITYQSASEDIRRLWPLLEKALREASSDLISSKEREGRMIKKNLHTIINSTSESLAKIKNRAPVVAKEYKVRLINNVKSMTGSKQILNHEKIEEEGAIFARNCDISEEIHRVFSHIAGFKKALSHQREVGRRLDFIAQEIYREVNTIGAKANDFQISKEVIKAKSLIEKIREQAQNVE